MDEQQPPQAAPIIPPPAATPPVAAPVAAALSATPTPPPVATSKPPRNNKLYILIGGVLCLAILITGVLYARSTVPTTEEVPVAVTPTVLPTPTPPPNLSRIASTSAFGAFVQEIASFSATLESFTLQDSTLAPPILDLELNLTN